MIPQATLLYQVQLLDLNLARRRNRLKEIAVLLKDSAKVVEAQGQFASAETALRPWATKSKDLDLEAKGLAQKIKETNDRLYGGKVRNPKELQEMQDEIVSLQKRQRQIEDTLIDAMLHVDEAQATLDAAREHLKLVSAEDSGSKMDLQAEQERLKGEIAKLEVQRKTAADVVTPAALQKYESMRVAKKGQPIAPLMGESCKLCGVEQTTTITQKVHQGNELIYCLSCGRILAMVPEK